MGRSHEKFDSNHRSVLRIVRQLTLSVKENTSETLLIGTLADLLEEVKEVLILIRKTKKSKEESSHLFRSLPGRYRPLIGINYKDIISLFIFDACKNQYRAELTLDEIRSWWPDK